MNRLRSKMKGICCFETKVLVTLLFVAIAAAPAWASDWPSGPHENLLIKGTKTCGEIPSGAGGGNRATIFVPLTTMNDLPGVEPESTTFDASDTSIFLIQGPTFAVCNGDACTTAVNCAGAPLGGSRTTGAVFQLPCDVLAPDGTITACGTCTTPGGCPSATYCIYAEALGKPEGEQQITTCGVFNGTLLCSTGNAMLLREEGGPKVQNVTFALTTLTTTCVVGAAGCPCPGTLGSPAMCTFEIFNSAFQFFLWDVDNAGLKTAQLRFYPTTVNAGCPNVVP